MSNVVETYNTPNRPFTLDDVKRLFCDTYGIYPLSVKYVQKEFTFNDSGLQKILDHPIFVTAVYCDMDISKYDSDKKFYTFYSPQIISSVSNEKLKEGFQFGNKPFEPYGFWQTIAMFYTTATGSKKKAGSNIPDELVFAPTNRNEIETLLAGKEVFTYYGEQDSDNEDFVQESELIDDNEGNEPVLLRTNEISDFGEYKLTICGFECETPFYPFEYWRAMTNGEAISVFTENPSIFAIIDNQYEGLVIFPEGYIEKSNAQYTIKPFYQKYGVNDDIICYNETYSLFEISIDDFKIMQDNGARFFGLLGYNENLTAAHYRGLNWTSTRESSVYRMFCINKFNSVSVENSNNIQINSRTYSSYKLALRYIHVTNETTLKFKMGNNKIDISPTSLCLFKQDISPRYVFQNITLASGESIEIRDETFFENNNLKWVVKDTFYIVIGNTSRKYEKGALIQNKIEDGILYLYLELNTLQIKFKLICTQSELAQGITHFTNTGNERTFSIFFEKNDSSYYFGKYGYQDYSSECVIFTFSETQKQHKILKI